MLKCKEIKGTAANPNIDEAINDFFESCNEDVSILNLYYSSASVPTKTPNGAVSYQVVSSCLIFYSEGEE